MECWNRELSDIMKTQMKGDQGAINGCNKGFGNGY